MLPLRYDFLHLGGSWTQRQVFNVTIIQAAVKANKLSLALALVAELKVCVCWLILLSSVAQVYNICIQMFKDP